MDVDTDQDGIVTIQDLVQEIHKQKQIFPMPIFNFFINVLRETKIPEYNLDHSFEKHRRTSIKSSALNRLSLLKLNSVIQIFNRCPMFTHGSTNNSNNFKNSVCLPGFIVSNEDTESLDEGIFNKIQ